MLIKDIITEAVKNDLDQIKAELKAKYGDKEVGSIYWQVYGDSSFVGVGYDLTYRRNTPAGAWAQYSSRLEAANNTLKSIADAYKRKFKVEVSLAKKPTKGEYSEYEQSLGGDIRIKLKEPKAKPE